MWFLFFILMGVSGISAIIFLILTIMKRKRAWIGLVASAGVGAFATAAFIIAFIFSAPTESVPAVAQADSEIGAEQVDEEPAKPIDERFVELNAEYEYGGLTVVIEDIDITRKYVTLGVTVRNDSEGTLSFYPSQGDIIIGNKQLDSNFLMNKGSVDGDIHAGVEKSGTFKYVADDDGLEPGDITEVKLMFGSIYGDAIDTEEFTEVITLD